MTLQPEEKAIAGNLAKTVGVLVGVTIALAFFSIYLAGVVG